MQVRRSEIDSLFYGSLGFSSITEYLKSIRESLIGSGNSDVHTQAKLAYIRNKKQFIKDNEIRIIEYNGDEVWGEEIFDTLLLINDYLNNNNVFKEQTLFDFLEHEFYVEKKKETGLRSCGQLIKRLKEMNVITKKDGVYKWTGSTNFTVITKNIVKNYE